MKKKALIHLVADYGAGDPAFTEVIQKLILLEPDLSILPTSVPSFATLATGFWTYQYALVNPIPGMVIYTNTAPRKDLKEKREANEGEGLMYAELENGVRVVGVNASYCFSFVKSEIKKLAQVNVANKGSQFRSRDFYPEAVVGIINQNDSFIGRPVDKNLIPDPPVNRLAWIDGYGNLKTTTRHSESRFTVGQPVVISLNGIKRTAFFTDGTFAVREGQLAFAPGSSGGKDRFMEIFLRGLSAWRDFGKPVLESGFSVY
jgi:hypothetical protein